MALPVTIPNTFANATASIPLSQLDTNFNTLANAVNGISDGSESLANVSVTGGTISNVAVSATTLNTSGAVVFNDAGADVDFRVEGDTEANLLFVDASADAVGIGTNTPGSFAAETDSRLVVGTGSSTTGAITLYSGNTSHGAINWADGTSGAATYAGILRYDHNLNTMQFYTNGLNERMRIDSSGNLLVGATSQISNERLNVTVGNAIGFYLKNATGDSEYTFKCWNATASGDTLWVDFINETSQTRRGSIDYNRAAGLTRYNTTSDATLKNIIGDSDGQKSVEILNSTRIREYAWKEDETQKPQIGVIAQELYETYKGAVLVGGDVERQRDVTEEVEEEYTDEEGNTQTRTVTRVVGQETYTEYRPWGVDKTAFTFHLVAGWQAHEKIIKQQADMIAALEARIAALEGQ